MQDARELGTAGGEEPRAALSLADKIEFVLCALMGICAGAGMVLIGGLGAGLLALAGTCFVLLLLMRIG